MGYTLVIVESPAKCKKIEEYLNASASSTTSASTTSYKCIASFGHICELPGLAAIDIQNNFAPTFIECASKKEQIGKIKKALKDADEVILASDDDREGEAIAWHLCQVFGLPVDTTKRILFHEITEKALKAAIGAPSKINMAVVQAQLARQVLDMLVGYKLSPLLWKHVKDGLSAGRCQTPALRLIYDNQREIALAPGKKSYKTTGYFTSKNIPFLLNHEETDEVKMRDFLKASLTFAHIYQTPKIHVKTSAAPQPFSTSTLQQAASNELHLSPKETMSLCQSLYEAGYITYHRTDCQEFSKEFKQAVSKYIEKTYGVAYIVADAYIIADKDKAHEAIRPTNIEWNADDKIKGKEYRLYNLIRRRALESSMPAASISVLTAGINAPQNYTYHFTAEHIIFAGWLIINENSNTTNSSTASASSTASEYTYLQTLKPLSSLQPKKIKAALHLTETKQHYTEAKLVNLLETKGIGRPSTFSSIIDKIQERGYVKKENVPGQMLPCVDFEMSDGGIKTTQAEREFGAEKNKLVITPVGILALEFLLKHFDPFFQYNYTKEMEDDLDLVVQGTTVWHTICQKYYTELEHLSSSITERGKEIIRIDAEHTYMIGKYGPVIKHQAADKKKTITFKAVRKDLDLNKLRNGEYSLEEVLQQAQTSAAQVQASAAQEQSPSIGTHQDKPVYIKVGKFGKYLEWNGMNKSLKHLKMKPDEITMDDVIELLFDTENELENTRVLTPDATIKKGKYGYYIYYKNKKMKKPRFLKLDGFKGDYLTCDIETIKEWFEKTYWGETPHTPHTPH